MNLTKRLSMKVFLLAGIAAATLLLGGNAQAALIDDFNGGFDSISSGFVTTRYENALGGQRVLQIDNDSSQDGTLSVTLQGGGGGGNGILSADADDFLFNSSVRWNAPGADLTDGGSSDRFAIDFLSVRPEDTFSLRVAGGVNDRSVDFTVDGPGIKTILFSDFPLLITDFETVSTVQLFITGDSPLSNIQIDSIQTTVPVPAAFWLLGTGLIGLFGIKRRLKK